MKNKEEYEPKFLYNEETGETICYIYSTKIPSLTFKGKAHCHPSDKKYQSRRIGENISYKRASLKAMRYILNQGAIPELNIYKDIYDTFNSSPKYNLISAEAKLIKRKLNAREQEVETIKEMIANCEYDLKHYITTINMIHTDKKE